MNTKDSVSSIDHFAPAAGLLRWAEAQPGRRYENQAESRASRAAST